MEHFTDNWKKYPLCVLGSLPHAPVGTPAIDPADLGPASAELLNNLNIIVALESHATLGALKALFSLGINPDQIIVFWTSQETFQNQYLPVLGVLDNIEGESVEEFRQRLMSKLECQRQKRLGYALTCAEEAGLSTRLTESELAHTVDHIRIAHALACSYGLPPAKHNNLLKKCLEGQTKQLTSWPADIEVDSLIIEASRSLLQCLGSDVNLRDAIRERAALLPFRARTDLLHHIENCLGPLLGGRNAA